MAGLTRKRTKAGALLVVALVWTAGCMAPPPGHTNPCSCKPGCSCHHCKGGPGACPCSQGEKRGHAK